MTLHELNVMAMRERATIYHTMRLSCDDSEMLAAATYRVLAAATYRVLVGMLPSFRDFCEGLQDGSHDALRYHGMKIEWFCDGPTRFVLESFIYN